MVSVHNLVIKFSAAFTEFELIFLKSIIRTVLILFIFLCLFFFPLFWYTVIQQKFLIQMTTYEILYR